MPDIPQAVERVAREWLDLGRPSQPAIPWAREQWLADFAANAAALSALPDRLDRPTVMSVGVRAPLSPTRAADAFLAVMAWAYGDVGYGRFRTARVLASRPDAAERLHAVAQTVVEDGALSGYRALATTCRLEGLGPSFGTKLLYFWQPTAARPRAR